MGAGDARICKKRAKSGKLAEITGAEQGRNWESRPHTRDSPVPAKDDVLIVLVGSSLFDHAAKALPHLLQIFAYVPPEVMGARFIAALLLRLQTFVSDRLHVSAFGIIVDRPDSGEVCPA